MEIFPSVSMLDGYIYKRDSIFIFISTREISRVINEKFFIILLERYIIFIKKNIYIYLFLYTTHARDCNNQFAFCSPIEFKHEFCEPPIFAACLTRRRCNASVARI